MKRFRYSSAFAVLAFAMLFAGWAPRAAAQDGAIAGQILDVVGKPWVDVPLQITSDQGTKLDTKTDKNGKYSFNNLRSGTYVLSVTLPGQAQPYVGGQVKVSSGQTVPVDLNFKDIVGKQGKEYEEAKQKQEQEKQKFQGMKQHFEAGIAALDQARQAKTDMQKAPADQRDALKANVNTLNEKAVTEFEAAKAASNEKDTNLQLIMARLGDAYDAAGRTDDATAAYKRAIELKPSFAYYNNLGGIYGRAGKIDEASAAYQKAAELDPEAPEDSASHRPEAGTLSFTFLLDEQDEDLYYAIEQYADRTAQQAHGHGAVIQRWAPEILPLLAGPPVVLASGDQATL